MKTIQERAKEACDAFAQYGYMQAMIAMMCQLVEDCAKIADAEAEDTGNYQWQHAAEQIGEKIRALCAPAASSLPATLDNINIEYYQHNASEILRSPDEDETVGFHRIVECIEQGHVEHPHCRLVGRGGASHLRLLACKRCGLFFFEDGGKKERKSS